MARNFFLLSLFLFLILQRLSHQIHFTDNLPSVKDSDVYEVYYLESNFPPYTPPSIISLSGAVWSQFSFNHAGIGFKAHKEFVFDLVDPVFLGGVFPYQVMLNETSSDDYVWNNTASIQVADFINSTFWRSASFLGEVSGSVIQAMMDDMKEYPSSIYQPLTAVTVSDEEEGQQQQQEEDEFSDLSLFPNNFTSLFIDSTGSYDFVAFCLNSIASTSAPLSSVVSLYQTTYTYFISDDDGDSMSFSLYSNPQVSSFFSSYFDCVQGVWLGPTTGGAAVFWQTVGSVCLSSTSGAYLYHNSSHAVHLPNLVSPYLYTMRIPFPLPNTSSSDNDEDTTWVSITIVSLIGFLVWTSF